MRLLRSGLSPTGGQCGLGEVGCDGDGGGARRGEWLLVLELGEKINLFFILIFFLIL